jgi:predicted HTH transcriptional regulator
VDKRTIFLIGLNFSSKTRRLEEWEIGQKVVKENGQKGGQRKSPKGGHRGGHRTEEVFELIKANPSITREQLSEILHIVPSAVQKHVNKLKIDRIRRIKGKQKGHWEIIDKD